MRQMRAVFCGFLALLLLACGSDDSASPQGTTRISIQVDEGQTAMLRTEPVLAPVWRLLEKLGPAAAVAVPNGVTAVRVTVSGEGMLPISQTVSVSPATTYVVIDVPNGPQRLFQVDCLDRGGVSLYSGQFIVDLNGTPVSQPVAMQAAGPGTVTGRVEAFPGGEPLSGVTVTASGGVLMQPATVLTGQDGSYSFTLPAGSGYLLDFSFSGYLPAQLTVAAPGDQTTPLSTVQMLPEGDATISGTVYDAVTLAPVPGLTVSLRSAGATAGTVVASAVTDAQGVYAASFLYPGTYTLEAAGAGYLPAYATAEAFGAAVVTAPDIFVSSALGPGQYRIVLTWGAEPPDLDSHLTGPSGSLTPFHLYYGNDIIYDANQNVIAGLDVDDTSSYGPETTTIYQSMTGTYTFYVHDFSNDGSTTSTALGNSGAQVTLYGEGGRLGSFTVPAGGGTLWEVFTLADGTVTPVNRLSYNAPPVYVPTDQLPVYAPGQ